jgi:hypothetical protein
MRAVLLIAALACAACGGRRTPPVAAPPAAPAVPAHEPPIPRLAGSRHDLLYCVVRRGELVLVPLEYNTRTGDTTYQGVPLARAFPLDSAYAEAADWFAASEPIRFDGRTFARYGDPRLLGIGEVMPVGEYRGVGVYAEAGLTGPPAVLYLPVRPGCMFQPYPVSLK